MWKRVSSYFRYRLFNIYSTEKCIEVPQEIDNYIIYLVDKWVIVFKCPCGCKNDIYLNTLQSTSPRWSYKIDKRRINVMPSIRRKSGCKSHFWIRRGKIDWCS